MRKLYLLTNIATTGAKPTPIWMRYSLVGALVAFAYWTLANLGFALLPNLPAWLVSNLALLIAKGAQYLGHARYTFRTAVWDGAQSTRFAATIAAGLILSTLATGWLAPALDVPLIWATAFVMVAVPLLNFILFRKWVFRG